MAIVQNTSKGDRHLCLHNIINHETGEGKTIEYIIPHKRHDINDLKTETDSGRREIPDEFLKKVRENVAVEALFEDGILTVVKNKEADQAEKREDKFDDSLSKKVAKVEKEAKLTAAVASALAEAAKTQSAKA